MTAQLALAARRFQLAIALSKNLRLASFQLGQRRYIVNRAVQPHAIVMVHVPAHQAAGVLDRQGKAGSADRRLCGLRLLVEERLFDGMG